MEEASEVSDGGEELKESNPVDVSYEFKPDNKDIRFDFPSRKSLSVKSSSPKHVPNTIAYYSSKNNPRMFDDPEMEKEYQTLIADSDPELNSDSEKEDEYWSASDAELLVADEDKSSEGSVTFMTPRTPRSFLRTGSDSEEEASDMELQKRQASKIFNRKRRV